MRRLLLFLPMQATLVAMLALLASCNTMNFTAPLEGRYSIVVVADKDFEVIGAVRVSAVETHRVSPLGITRTVEGSKVTYAQLWQEAVGLGADDIIDIRIDMNTGGRAGFADWLIGWERTFTHTGQALAIRYISNTN